MAVPDDDESRATPQQPGPDPITTAILADRRRARSRIRTQEEHRRVCRELEQIASLVEYYCGPRRWVACCERAVTRSRATACDVRSPEQRALRTSKPMLQRSRARPGRCRGGTRYSLFA